MRPFIFLLLLEGGVCAVALLHAWERRSMRASWLLTTLALAVALVAGAVAVLLGLSPRWFPGWNFIVGVIFMIIAYLTHALMLRRQRERDLGGLTGIVSSILWHACHLGGVAFVMLLSMALGSWFNRQYAVGPELIPFTHRALGAMIAGAVLSGGLLLAVSLYGALCGMGGMKEPASKPALAVRMNRARLILIGVLYLRFVAILFSLWLWAARDVGSMRLFLEEGVEGVAMFSMLRIFLGVMLPAFSVGTIGVALASGSIRVARWYFILTLIFILIGEIMALTLTAGLRGIAF